MSLPCALSAEQFWELRSDIEFDRYFTACDGQIYQLLQNDVTPELTSRIYKLAVKENPVPKALHGALPKMDEFCFRVECSMHPTRYDRAHPYRYGIFVHRNSTVKYRSNSMSRAVACPFIYFRVLCSLTLLDF